MNLFKKIIPLTLIASLIIMFAAGCGEDKIETDGSTKTFHFTIVDGDNNKTEMDIASEKATVGEALLDEKIIEGTEGDYGLYVTKVNGIEAIYENDGTYWSFYIDGEYAMSGVDSTAIEDGGNYMFKVEGN